MQTKPRKKLKVAALLVGVPLLLTACGRPAEEALASIMDANPSANTVQLFLSMGHKSENLDANYNGFANGHLLISVPVGSKVILHITNDGGIPFTSGVYTKEQQVAFPGSGDAIANLVNSPTAGIMPGNSAKLTFIANKVGHYRLESLLYRYPSHHPTHTPLGLWAQFNVTQSGKAEVRSV